MIAWSASENENSAFGFRVVMCGLWTGRIFTVLALIEMICGYFTNAPIFPDEDWCASLTSQTHHVGRSFFKGGFCHEGQVLLDLTHEFRFQEAVIAA